MHVRQRDMWATTVCLTWMCFRCFSADSSFYQSRSSLWWMDLCHRWRSCASCDVRPDHRFRECHLEDRPVLRWEASMPVSISSYLARMVGQKEAHWNLVPLQSSNSTKEAEEMGRRWWTGYRGLKSWWSVLLWLSVWSRLDWMPSWMVRLVSRGFDPCSIIPWMRRRKAISAKPRFED